MPDLEKGPHHEILVWHVARPRVTCCRHPVRGVPCHPEGCPLLLWRQPHYRAEPKRSAGPAPQPTKKAARITASRPFDEILVRLT